MEFSVLDWITLVVILGSVLYCTLRGFAKSIIGALKLVGAFLLAKIFGPIFGAGLAENVFGPKVYRFIEEKIAGMIGGLSDSMNLSALFDAESNDFVALLNRFGAGEKVAELEEAYGQQLSATQASLTEMVKSFASPWVERFSTAVASILVFVVAFIGLWFVAKLLVALVEHFAVLGKINRILGAVLGLVVGLALIGGACYLYSVIDGIMAMSGSGGNFMEKIDASVIFSKIYYFVLSIASK